jgi:hypothetical protein
VGFRMALKQILKQMWYLLSVTAGYLLCQRRPPYAEWIDDARW